MFFSCRMILIYCLGVVNLGLFLLAPAEKQVTNVSRAEVATKIALNVTSKTMVATPRLGVNRTRLDSLREPPSSDGDQFPVASPRRVKTQEGVTIASLVHVVSPVKSVMMPQAIEDPLSSAQEKLEFFWNMGSKGDLDSDDEKDVEEGVDVVEDVPAQSVP
ncbi:hypothetical protein L6452_38904 [Arctium lappa]|uniref:Uncharacterized protein n=1 Tax=Arctium lappa TaxID=4217 RepID=A0ACB8XRD9_ARCLA|nr:hypothetical protein L6452_38904 [Arctium lappa]